MAFRNLLSETDDWRPNINGLAFESLYGSKADTRGTVFRRGVV